MDVYNYLLRYLERLIKSIRSDKSYHFSFSIFVTSLSPFQLAEDGYMDRWMGKLMSAFAHIRTRRLEIHSQVSRWASVHVCAKKVRKRPVGDHPISSCPGDNWPTPVRL